MKLSESDIKAIASRRFWDENHRAWKIAGILVGGSILSCLIAITAHDFSIIPMLLALGYAGWVCFKSYRYEKAFLAEWKRKENWKGER